LTVAPVPGHRLRRDEETFLSPNVVLLKPEAYLKPFRRKKVRFLREFGSGE
jgi:hypothetical protein